MSNVKKVTIEKLIDGSINLIYPRTSADMVVYDESISIKDKIDNITNEVISNTTTISNSDFIGLKCHVRGGYNYIGLRTELKSVFSSSNSNIPIRTGDTIRINGIYPISS